MKPERLLLLVPLAFTSLGFSALTPQQLPSAPVWRQSQKTNSRGTAYTQFTLEGKFLKAPQKDAPNRPALVVDCRPGKNKANGRFISATLLVGTTMKIDYVEPLEIHGTSYYPKISVRYRLDDAKEEEEKWAPGADKASAIIPKDWLKKILRAHTVEVSGNDDQGSELALQFNLPTSTPVEDACNVDDRKK
jgi:hypothetical protein